MKVSIDGYVRQKDNPGAALNTDRAALKAYKARKARENEINTMREEISEVRTEIKQIHSLLSLIAEKIK